MLPFLWKIRKGDTVSYAVGTVHLSDKDYSSVLEQYLYDSEVLLTEASLDESLEAYEGGLDFSASGSKGMLGKLSRRQAKKFREITGATKKEFKEMKSWPDTKVSWYYTVKSANLESPYNIMDLDLVRSSARLGIESHGLETDEERIEYMDIFSSEADCLGYLIKDLERETPISVQVLDLYDSGDDSGLLNLFYDDVTPEMHQSTLKRNAKMAERSMEYMDRPCLVAVGLVHFLSEESMLDHYREAGLEVSRVEKNDLDEIERLVDILTRRVKDLSE